MGRPRKSGRKDWTPGLYREKYGAYYTRHPETRKRITLDKDEGRAKQMLRHLRDQWEEELIEALARKLAARLAQAQAPTAGGFPAFLARFREEVLPGLCSKRGGDPLKGKTRADYERIYRQAEQSETLNIPLPAVDEVILRKYLAQWLDSPSYYNYVRAAMTRALDRAVAEGLIRTNPMGHVARLRAGKRKVYCPDDAYLAITAHMEDWEARACDLIYMVSQDPIDALALTEANIDGHTIRFRREKTGPLVEIEMNADAQALLQWFRDWKQAQGIITPHFVVYPTTKRRRDVGRPVTREYLYRRWVEALNKAGYPTGTYTLKDLRKKGLTDEHKATGEVSMKGGHKTRQMAEHYVCAEIPIRARMNVRRITGASK